LLKCWSAEKTNIQARTRHENQILVLNDFFGFFRTQGRTTAPTDCQTCPKSAHFRLEKPKRSVISAIFRPQERLHQPIFLKFTGFMCSYSPHIRLKFGEIRFINQGFNRGFITERPCVNHFPPKFRGPLFQKLGAESQNNCLRKNGTDVLYPPAKFGGDRFTHGDARTKIREFLFCLFVTLDLACFCLTVMTRGLLWSRRTVAMFGTLTKYSIVI